MKYKSLKQLNGKTLKVGDEVILGTSYEVRTSYLSNNMSGDNSLIFSKLGVDENDFCTAFYGYPHRGGSFPECNDRDVEALTRVVLALFVLIEGSSYTVRVHNKDVLVTKSPPAATNIISLDSSYEAVLCPDSIRVGCQNISYTALDALYKAAVKGEFINKKNGRKKVQQTTKGKS